MTHSLLLGDLVLTGDASLPDPTHGFWFEVCAEGTEFGSPEAVTRIVTSLLTDGAIVSYDSDANRTIPVRVRVNGPTLAAVAQGEAALRRATRRYNELTWQPPDTFAPPSVYETFPSPMQPVQESGWDLDEKMRRARTVSLALNCSPFARSAEATTVGALEVGSGATAVVDSCDSATGWSATVNGSAVGVDPNWLGTTGAVFAYDFGAGPQTIALTRSGSFSVATRPYVRIRADLAASSQSVWADAVIDGVLVSLPLLSQRQVPGLNEFVFAVPAGSSVVTSLTVSNYSTGDAAAFGISEVAHMGSPPGETPRQQSRIIEVGGTERTPASIHVRTPDGTGSLSQVIVHTSPEDGSGYSPPLRRWRNDALSTGPVTTSAGRLSGFYEPLVTATGGFVAEVPTSALPSGGYILMGLIGVANVAGGSPQIYWSTSTIFPDSTTQQGYANGSVVYDFPDDGWHLVPLAALSLPSVRTSSGKVQIVLQVLSHPDEVYLDEAWLFRADDDCALTIVNTERPQLWLDSAGPSSPVPTVWIGDDASNRVHPGEGLLSMGHHVLSPDGTAVFTAAPVDSPVTDATFYRRWHSNAAE